jgi:hypothetical protein
MAVEILSTNLILISREQETAIVNRTTESEKNETRSMKPQVSCPRRTVIELDSLANQVLSPLSNSRDCAPTMK